MYKFEKLINSLTLEEKITLLTSFNPNETSRLENYDFPTLELNSSSEYYEVPNYSALGATFNEDLIQDFGKNIGYDKVSKKDHSMVKLPVDDLSLENDAFGTISPLVIKLASALSLGVNKTGAFAYVDRFKNPRNTSEKDYYELNHRASKIILEGIPAAVLMEGANNGLYLRDKLKYPFLKMAKIKTAEELIQSINLGNGFNFILNDEIDPILVLNSALENYRLYKKELRDERINESDFALLMTEGVMTNIDKLNDCVENLLEELTKFENNNNYDGRGIDPVNLTDVIRESFVLIKNENHALPARDYSKVCLIGPKAKEFRNNEELTAFNVIRDINLNVTGYSSFYFEDESLNASGKEKALELANRSEYAIVYLHATEDNKVPEADLEILKTLKAESKAKVVAVIDANYQFDFSFMDYCDSVLLTTCNCEDINRASLEIIAGMSAPAGFLPTDLKDLEGQTIIEAGFGLSYGNLVASKVTMTNKEISFNVVNNGNKEAYGLFVLKVKYDEHEEIKEFVKVHLKPNGCNRYSIPLSPLLFTTYCERNHCLEIVSGNYELNLEDNLGHVVDSKTLHFRNQLFDDEVGYSTLINEYQDLEVGIEDFVSDTSRKIFFHEQRGLSFKSKILIEVLLLIYATASLSFFGILGKYNYGSSTFLYLSLATLGVVDLILIIAIIKTCRKRKYEFYQDNNTLTRLLNTVKPFNEVARETYALPVIEEPEEETDEEKETDLTTADFDETLTDGNVGNANYVLDDITDTTATEGELKNSGDFESISLKFAAYALHAGLIIEPAAIRNLFAALATSNLIFIKSNQMELLPRLAETLDSFLGNEHLPYKIDNEVNSLTDLFWTGDGNGNLVRSNLNRSLKKAMTNSRRINLVTIENVSNANLEHFEPLIKFAENPASEIKVDLLDDGINHDYVTLVKNSRFIIIPDDMNYLESLPKRVASCSVNLDMTIRVNEIIGEEVPNEQISYQLLLDLTKEAKEQTFLEEDSWKKLDDLEEAINNVENFRIENKVMLNLEKYSSVLLAAGTTKDEVMDQMIAYVVIPILKSTKCYQTGGRENLIYQTLDRLFEIDNVPLSVRALKNPLN